MEEGPKFGYFSEPDKSYLVVHPNLVDEAKLLFAELKLNVSLVTVSWVGSLEVQLTQRRGLLRMLKFG